MKSKLAARYLILALYLVFSSARGQENEDPGFREPLYFSNLDRDQRTPQAVRLGGVVFVSAMGSDGESLEEQLRLTYIRLQSVLGNYGLRMSDVAQERIYLKSGQSFEAVSNARLLVYSEDGAPASTMVEVSNLHQTGRLVSIELIAVANPEAE